MQPQPTNLPLLYVHGFGSTGHSQKARVLKAHFSEVYAPSLNPVPELAVETLEEFIRALDHKVALVGSSLGGFYALYLAQRHGLPAVLVNPALGPWEPLLSSVGIMHNYYDGARFEWTTRHVDTLHRFAVPAPDTRRLLLMLQLGDELLDHRQTLAQLAGAEVMVEEGGDHGYVDFASKMDAVADFLRRFE